MPTASRSATFALSNSRCTDNLAVSRAPCVARTRAVKLQMLQQTAPIGVEGITRHDSLGNKKATQYNALWRRITSAYPLTSLPDWPLCALFSRPKNRVYAEQSQRRKPLDTCLSTTAHRPPGQGSVICALAMEANSSFSFQRGAFQQPEELVQVCGGGPPWYDLSVERRHREIAGVFRRRPKPPEHCR